MSTASGKIPKVPETKVLRCVLKPYVIDSTQHRTLTSLLVLLSFFWAAYNTEPKSIGYKSYYLQFY